MGKNKKLITLFVVILLQAILISIAYAIGFWLGSTRGGLMGEFPILAESYEILKENTIKELPSPKAMEYGMVRGLLQVLNDPYTIFVEPPQHKLETNQLEGKFGGIGARIERNPAGKYLLFPYIDSPAKLAGIQDADQLEKVDDFVIGSDTTVEDVTAAVRGDVGTTVKISISRTSSQEEVMYSIVRKEITLPSLSWNLIPDQPQIGLVQINIISATTPDEVIKAINDLKSKNASHFIIDLRNNGGGLVDAGLKTAALFLNSGVIIEQQYRGQPKKDFPVNKPGLFADIPAVILINHGTASAAEIIAGSLQVQKRVQLIGSPSYGKDSIQLVFDLSDGSSLHVTAAHWWIPGLVFPNNGTGLIPDILFPEEETQSPKLLQAAIEKVLEN